MSAKKNSSVGQQKRRRQPKVSQTEDEPVGVLVQLLQSDDPESREMAIGKLSFFGVEAILAILVAMYEGSASARAAARSAFFTILRHQSFPPNLRKSLESPESKVRLEAIREIVRVVPEVHHGIQSRHAGWAALIKIIARQGTVTEDSMQKLGAPKPSINSAADQPLEPTHIPEWKPYLSSYQEKQLLSFPEEADLDAAIELLWTDSFASLPHCTPDGRTIIVPAEAVPHLLRAGLKFSATRLRSISDLDPDEISKLRR